MKRIITVGDTQFIIEGAYHARNCNYRIYDMQGNRPFEAGYISVKGEMKPLCVPAADAAVAPLRAQRGAR